MTVLKKSLKIIDLLLEFYMGCQSSKMNISQLAHFWILKRSIIGFWPCYKSNLALKPSISKCLVQETMTHETITPFTVKTIPW